MKLAKRAFVFLLGGLLCLQSAACSFSQEDISNISSAVSTLGELAENLSSVIKEEEAFESMISDTEGSWNISDIIPSFSNKEEEPEPDTQPETSTEPEVEVKEYTFRNNNLLTQHYEKHGIEMGYLSKEAYEKAASDVINNPKALHKKEAEDNDDVFYIEETNEFVILSSDGFIRTYFNPSAGIEYYNRQ